MNPENPSRKVFWYTWIATGIVGLCIFSLGFPAFTDCRERGPLTALINNAKHLIISVQLYAGDHEGKYPHDLADLVKEGLLKDQHTLDKLLSHPLEKPLGWIYLPDLSDKSPASYPIFISPILQDNSGPLMHKVKVFMGYRPFSMKPQRVVAFNDTSVEFLPEVEVQKILDYHGIKLPVTEAVDAAEK